MADPFELSRFVVAQEPVYQDAVEEIRRGWKESHWMWFIFPQLAGLGRSQMAQRYAIADIEEASAYLAHPILGPRLRECSEAVLAVQGKTAHDIFSSPDDMKLRSSMTLFSKVPSAPPVFAEVLQKYFRNQPDERTLELLAHGV